MGLGQHHWQQRKLGTEQVGYVTASLAATEAGNGARRSGTASLTATEAGNGLGRVWDSITGSNGGWERSK
jgi:hypothetical protein